MKNYEKFFILALNLEKTKKGRKNMTNADKYLKDGVDDRDFAKALSNYIADGGRKITDKEDIRAETLYFLTDEAKPTLSEDEKVILKNIPNAQKIFRTSCGLYIEFPDEGKYTKISKGFSFYEHLFKFIKPRRRI